jgi:hypothetical protein
MMELIRDSLICLLIEWFKEGFLDTIRDPDKKLQVYRLLLAFSKTGTACQSQLLGSLMKKNIVMNISEMVGYPIEFVNSAMECALYLETFHQLESIFNRPSSPIPMSLDSDAASRDDSSDGASSHNNKV